MYNFNITLQDRFEHVIQRVTEALQQEKFGILNEIAVDTVLKNKLGIEIPRYRILHACNPSFAHRMVSNEPNSGCLLPCNVLVREEDEKTTSVAFMDPVTVFGLTQNPAALAIAEEAKAGLLRAFNTLAGV